MAKYQNAWDAVASEDTGNLGAPAVMLLREWTATEAEMAAAYGLQQALYLYRKRPPGQEALSFLAWLRQHSVSGGMGIKKILLASKNTIGLKRNIIGIKKIVL